MGRVVRVTCLWVVFFSVLSFRLSAQNFSYKYSEKISPWLVFNQPKYSPGDTIFFTCYLTFPKGEIIKEDFIVDVDMLSSAGEIIDHAKFMLEDGLGFNYLIVPPGLFPGAYQVRAYSRYSFNFDPPLVKSYRIVVVDNGHEVLINPNLTYEINGGSLIDGLPASLIVRSHADSVVLIAISDSVYRKSLSRNDLGEYSLLFTPNLGTDYILQTNEKKDSVRLPEVMTDGLVLDSFEKKDTLHLNILTPKKSMYHGDTLILDTFQFSKIQHKFPFILPDTGRVSLKFPLIKFETGWIRFVLRSKKGVKLSSGKYVKENENTIQIVTDRQKYKVREKVRIGLINAHFDSVTATLKVINSDLFVKESLNQTEIHGIDEFEISRETSRYTGGNFKLSDKIIRSGKVFDKESGEPLPDGSYLLFFLQDHKQIYKAIVFRGEVTLEMNPFYGSDKLFYAAQDNDNNIIKDIRIEWEEDAPSNKSRIEYEVTEGRDVFGEYITKVKAINAAYAEANNSIWADTSEFNFQRTFERAIGAPDDIFQFDTYYLFPTMWEMIREVIRPLFVGKQKSDTIVQVRFLESPYKQKEPLFIIDNEMTFDTELFLSLNPKEVESVRIYKNPGTLARLGFLGRGGIIEVRTRSGSDAGIKNEEDLIQGLRKPVKPGRVVHSGSSNTPSYRPTVYWEPIITIHEEESIEFTLTDDVGMFKIILEGFSGNGERIYSEKEFEVGY